MAYVTPQQLADGADAASELAELYDVAPALLATLLAGGDTGAWPPEDLAHAQAAEASIGRYCADATAEVDARLAVRGYPLPQDPARFPVLVVWARAIARYHLHRTRDRTNEETGRIERDYREALRALSLVAEGKLTLGAGDPLAVDPDAGAGAVRIQSGPRLFSRSTLAGL